MVKQNELALQIVTKVFAGKTDLAGEPYLNHIFRVAEGLKEKYKDHPFVDELETVALLHDLLEDCPEWKENHLRALFNTSVVNAVIKLTKSKFETYDHYIQCLSSNWMARAVKIADLQDNMDVSRLPELKEKDIIRLKKYHKSYVYLSKKN